MGKFAVGKFGIVVLFCVTVTLSASAQTFTLLTKFNGTNGAWPTYGSLLQGVDGNFYGTTSFGGAKNAGSVFNISPSGSVTTFYSFCSLAACGDGSVPYAGLLQTLNGNFYGTTYEGGGANNGTIFELTSRGVLTTLHSFCSAANCADGATPYSGLIVAPNGNFYGTTGLKGGLTTVYGTVFEMTPAGQLKTLYTFCSKTNCSDGSAAAKGLTLATNGNFYGVTGDGGTSNVGTAFEITPAGKLTTIYSFNASQGEFPNALVQGANGNFYGTTSYGGANSSGVVFELTPSGQYTVLYNFCSQATCADGATPNAPLVQGTDGNLYGTTMLGGVAVVNGQFFDGYGTLFEITPTGQLTTLYTFCSQSGDCGDGAYPEAGLIQGTDGSFYGTTHGLPSCPGNCGTVFQLSTGLGAFVEASPDFNHVGRMVNILGNLLRGATSVTFNGVPETFKVVSSNYIKATVPTGATTGTIEVTTPSGVLKSSVPFHVLP